MSTEPDVREVERFPDSIFDSNVLAGPVLVCAGYEQTIRWRCGERLEHLFEEQCDRLRERGLGGQLAVDSGDVVLTYDQLDARANQLARYLLGRGVRAGHRVGLLLDDPVQSYAGMLAVLKVNAVYVPLDAGFPADRVSFIAQDAGISVVLTSSRLSGRISSAGTGVICVDEIDALIAAEDDRRLAPAEKGDPVDELCYIIYTSGSTGRPKGVPIGHASICNFVRVAAEVYGIRSADRVYQGMTIAFDFSVEEIWVPWMAGATLVPKPAGTSLLGAELGEFLRLTGVTALCCVPTLLATLEEDVPGLRFLLVSGEACPPDLISRWHRPGRRFLNVYGPTEATVTATWAVVHPDRPVTIGVPLPTYSVVILQPDGPAVVPAGEVGEIGIAGIGLTDGYLNRPELTGRVLLDDFLGIGANPSGRIYRTGDLGRINEDGEIEYHGRIDTQVKIRGYRIELTEIESVLLGVPGIAQAVVSTYEPAPGTVELVAYYRRRTDTAEVDPQRVYEQLRGRLPQYMVPAYLEELAVIPMLPSDKADRKNLPAPRGRCHRTTRRQHVGPATDTERLLADALAGILHLDRVSVDSHFFDDLGANSLLLARFCAQVRKQPHPPPLSMKDVYLQPTIRSLATTLEGRTPAVPAGAGPAVPASGQAPVSGRHPAPDPVALPVGTAQYVRCGALQLLVFVMYACLGALLIERSYTWISAGDGLLDGYARAVAFGGATFLALCIMPILLKWLLIGRWKRQEIPIWSLAYFRFWVVKVLIRSNPLALFAGSPLYVLYLRALGAKIGRGVAIFSRTVPVCTDLLTIGDDTVIRKDSFFTGYRARTGMIQTGRVTIGKDVLVGELTVLDIETSMGDRAQLGHSSSLQTGQAVPAGQRWHGSPAQRTDTDYRMVGPARCGTARRACYSLVQLLNVLVLTMPLGAGGATLLLTEFPLGELLTPASAAFTSWTFYREVLVLSFVLFFGGLLASLLLVVSVPRVLNLALRPGRVYPLYGLHYAIQRAIGRLTNQKSLTYLFGDSSYIVHYLRILGYDLSRVEQTGSNFGVEVKHDTPYLSCVGSGTMVSDALSFINADFSSTSFRVSQVSIGERNFLGNNIGYPAQGRTGNNCLLATKVMIPVDGEVRENTGLLGSPCFEIPRSVQRDGAFDVLKSGAEFRRRLHAKNRHNTVTMGLYLLVRWFFLFAVLLLGLLAADLFPAIGVAAAALTGLVLVGFTVAYFVLVDRATTEFRSLRPRFCSIYDSYFWYHERFWKVPATAYLQMFNGTPFKNLVWRLLGVRIGRRVFDDGCGMTERTLVTIGHDCTLNAGSTIQCHSLEDGTFKSDRSTLGSGCTLGVNAFVHYGVTMGDGAVLDADAFLMKGEEIGPQARWRGNPATEFRAGHGLGWSR
jgi:non-ribosomal peptide synthetase-like protein